MNRITKVSAFPIMVALTLISCGGERSAGKPGADASKSLVIAFDTSPTNLDARVGADQGSGRVFDLAYAGLVKVTPDMDYAPDIAERWETPDDKTIIFHLKPNVKFQDGRPVTSKDVKWTFESLVAESFASPKKSGYATVAAFEAPDDATFIIRLKEPNPGIFDNLTYLVVPEGADTNVFKSKPIGAGPYRVVSFQSDERVELEAFDGYHAGAPKTKNVTIRVIPDATTRVLELRRGTINFGLNVVPYDSVAEFEKNPDFKVVKEPGSIYQYLAFNLRDPRLKNVKVRQAIAHAIDRERIVRDLLQGLGTIADTMFPKGHWARNDNVTTFPYDPARAKKLLDEAGFRDPDGDGPKTRLKLSYKTSTDVESNQQAEMIQQMLKQVGVDVEIQSNEFGTFYDDIQKGNFQLFSLRRAGIVDPDFYHVIFHSRSVPPQGQNRGYFANAEVDQLIEQGRSTFDRARRKEAYVRIQEIVADELPYISLYHRYNIAVMRKNVNGFEMYPAGFLLSVPQMTVD